MPTRAGTRTRTRPAGRRTRRSRARGRRRPAPRSADRAPRAAGRAKSSSRRTLRASAAARRDRRRRRSRRRRRAATPAPASCRSRGRWTASRTTTRSTGHEHTETRNLKILFVYASSSRGRLAGRSLDRLRVRVDVGVLRSGAQRLRNRLARRREAPGLEVRPGQRVFGEDVAAFGRRLLRDRDRLRNPAIVLGEEAGEVLRLRRVDAPARLGERVLPFGFVMTSERLEEIAG